MRAVVQRAARAAVRVGDELLAAIGPGLLVLVGVGEGDDEADARALADKLAGLRVFPDADGKMNRSVADIEGAVLVVSQFTLLGDVRKGRRPSFSAAAPPTRAEELIEAVADRLRSHGLECVTGRFGAHMEVELVNDGPVTLVVETRAGRVV